MNDVNRNVSTSSVYIPLCLAGGFLLLSFYLFILETSIYAYVLPFFVANLFFSVILFHQKDKEVKRNDTMQKEEPVYSFYHCSFGLYFISFTLLSGITLLYLPVYHNGGNVFVWACAPMAVVLFPALFQAKKGMNTKRKAAH